MDARTTPPLHSLPIVCGLTPIGAIIDGYRSNPASDQPETQPDARHAASVGTLSATSTNPRIALAHDWLTGYRGGEAVLDAIVRLCADRFEIAGLFVMFDDGRPVTPAIDALPKVVSVLNRLPGAGRARRWLLPLYPRAVEDLSRRLSAEHARRPIDLVISTSSAAIKGLGPPVGIRHVCYCHSPARYLWSQTEQYGQGRGGLLRALGLRLFGDRLRAWDRRTSDHVTMFVANSKHTAREIARCYRRDAVVVHPPVRTEYFTPPPAGTNPRQGWLYVGALEPYKRVDLAIAAAGREMDRLSIVGSGTQMSALIGRATSNVDLAGRIADPHLLAKYRAARVLVFPQIEDFGIVAVEAQACGTPVVAFRAGGALDSVIEGKTGVFFDQPTPEALAEAARRCEQLGDVSAACRANAERFGEYRFEQAMLRVIEQELTKPRT